MSVSNQFISYVKFDDVKRILVAVRPQFQSHLQVEKNRQMIKKATMDVLQEDFVKLEIGKNICRITVKEGSEENSIKKLENELSKGLEMALKFFGLNF